MTIKFQQLSIRNFLSYGNNETIINLSDAGTTLIVGEDLDNTSHGRAGNGTGKTTVLNALVYSLYDKAISDIAKDDLVNNINKKDMVVKLTFTGADGTQYKIHRERAVKAGSAGNNVYLYINGDDKTPDSQVATNELIEKIIGIPYEMFVRIVVFSATHTPFLNLKSSQQTEIIEELFGLSAISTKSDMLKIIIKETKDAIAFKKVKVDSLVGEHDRYNSQLETTKSRVVNWEQMNTTELDLLCDFDPTVGAECDAVIASCTTKIATLRNTLVLQSAELHNEAKLQTSKIHESVHDHIESLRCDLKAQTAEVTNATEPLLQACNATRDQLSTALEFVNSEVSAIKTSETTLSSVLDAKNNRLLQYREELTHLQDATCPYCNQQFTDTAIKITEISTLIDSATVDIEEISSQIPHIQLLLVGKQQDVVDIKTNIVNNKERIDKIKLAKNAEVLELDVTIGLKIRNIEQSIIADVAEVDNVCSASLLILTNEANTNIQTLNIALNQANTNKRDFDNAQSKLHTLKTAVNPYLDTLDDLIANKPADVDYTDINKLTTQLEHQDFLLKLLTKKDSFVRKALLNKNLPLLNARLHHYLSQLGLPHKVEFTKEMNATISQFGRNLGFGNLSAGQKARVNFALSLSFRDVLQKLHPRVNVCVLDEVLDTALDGIGVQLAANLIKQKAIDESLTMFVISHREELASTFPNIMTIQLKDGFSNVKPK